jgi:alkylhydroperoxidase family enzyme
MGCHAEFLRVALDGRDDLSRAVLEDPHAVAARWHEPRIRMLAELAMVTTLEPWRLTRAHRERARAAGLGDAEIVHAIALTSYFGHLNRIADATAVPLDYHVQLAPMHAEPATPPLARAPARIDGAPVLSLDIRPATAAALRAWSDYLLDRDPANAEIAAWAAELVGDGAPAGGEISERRRLVEIVVLAPWRLSDDTFAPLRAIGYDDTRLFGLCAAASSFGTMSRLRVALIALGREPWS